MITCQLSYVIDAEKINEFEHYAKLWIAIVNRLGGQHHGYFLPSESTGDIGLALVSFPSFAAYEQYKEKVANDADSQAAINYAKETKCITRFERSFLRPVLS
ncbi:NIPSNAP family protein [Leucothrix arctica]|uniref:NIPSNAP family protein n=1 Tax=Leucothrix arctica TaxID=1481894 RepID=A0A317CEF6_9GAMM|nr:NIPSNAP family protein [Leucothrix arctica]PWQ94502.1 NIPSNAP family protein [Leucothrix arctica]